MFGGDNHLLMIGPRNVEAVERLLAERNLKIAGKNVGKRAAGRSGLIWPPGLFPLKC